MVLNVGLMLLMQTSGEFKVPHILITGPLIYVYMILMHLIGRFYYRYEERLDW